MNAVLRSQPMTWPEVDRRRKVEPEVAIRAISLNTPKGALHLLTRAEQVVADLKASGLDLRAVHDSICEALVGLEEAMEAGRDEWAKDVA